MSKIIYTEPAKRFYVYAFLREDSTPYYIGKGTGNRAWVKSGRQVSPPTESSRISILFENLTESEAFSEEIRIIQFYGRKDNGTGILRNLTDGGEGISGLKHAPEALAKISAARTGKNRSPETIAKVSAANTGQKRSPETIAKMSAARTGKRDSAETRAKKSAATSGANNPMFGKCHTPESRANSSAAKSGEKNPMYGKKHSPETIAKRLATMARNKEATAEIFI